MASILPNGKNQFFDQNGDPLVGGQVWTYEPGTTTPKLTYSDEGATVPNTNPVILDSRGEALIFWVGAYSVTLLDALGGLIYTVDGIQEAEAAGATDALREELADDTDNTRGAYMIGLLLSGAGEQPTNMGDFADKEVKGFQRNFGAAGDGVTNNYDAFVSMLTSTDSVIEIEPGTYLVDGALALPVPTCSAIIGWGPDVSIIQIGAAITDQVIDATAFLRLSNFKLRGAEVAGVGGIYYGKSAIWYGESHNVRVENFKCAGSYGMRLGDAQKRLISHPYLDGNYDNCRSDRTSPGFPTSPLIDHPIIVNAEN